MNRRNLLDAIKGCPICGRHLAHLSFCARRHDTRTCRCPYCTGHRDGYLACAVDDVRLKHLIDVGFSADQAAELARIREQAA